MNLLACSYISGQPPSAFPCLQVTTAHCQERCRLVTAQQKSKVLHPTKQPGGIEDEYGELGMTPVGPWGGPVGGWLAIYGGITRNSPLRQP